MLHGSETWPVRKENVVALQRAEWSGGCVALSQKQGSGGARRKKYGGL